MRALRLAHQLANSETWCAGCAAGGGVAAAVQLAGLAGTAMGASSSLTVQLPALQVLLRMARVSKQAAAAIMLFRQQVLDGLMAVVLGAGTAMPATAPVSSTKNKPAGQDTKAVSVTALALTVCELGLQCAGLLQARIIMHRICRHQWQRVRSLWSNCAQSFQHQ